MQNRHLFHDFKVTTLYIKRISPRFIKSKVIRSFTESLAHSPFINHESHWSHRSLGQAIDHRKRILNGPTVCNWGRDGVGGFTMRVSTAGKGEREKHVERGSTLVNRKPARVLFCEAGADEKLDCAFNPLTVPFTRVFFSFQITNWTEESPPSPPPPPLLPRRDSGGKEERYLMIHHCVCGR